MNRPELFEEVKLFKSAKERSKIDSLADLFSIIMTVQALERAFIGDRVKPQEYTALCTKLLTQYKAAYKEIQSDYPEIEAFIAEYKMEASAALSRIKEGRPITIKDDKGNQNKCIADVVSLFITLMDHLRLNMKATDELYPHLKELVESMNRMSTLSDEFEPKVIVKKWLVKLEGMAAHEELSDNDVRQFTFELENAYGTFTRALH